MAQRIENTTPNCPAVQTCTSDRSFTTSGLAVTFYPGSRVNFAWYLETLGDVLRVLRRLDKSG
jgi:hypothetical protein